MPTWTENELHAIGTADELELSSLRDDGTLRPFVTIWAVRVGDDLYVRSAHGRENGWFRRALRRYEGRIEAGGVTSDVTFEETDGSESAAVDEAYRTKYARYSAAYVEPVTDAASASATFRVLPKR